MRLITLISPYSEMKYEDIDEMNGSTDDSSSSRPLSQGSLHQVDSLGNDRDWDVLNSEDIEETESCVPDEQGKSGGGPGEEAGEQVQEGDDANGADGDSGAGPTVLDQCVARCVAAWQNAPVPAKIALVGGLCVILNELSTILGLYFMVGTIDNYPLRYLWLHNSLCKSTLSKAQTSLDHCYLVAAELENSKAYANRCIADFERVIDRHIQFCGWDKNSLIGRGYFSDLLNYSGDLGSSLYDRSRLVLEKSSDGAQYLWAQSCAGVLSTGQYLSDIGLNGPQLRKVGSVFADTLKQQSVKLASLSYEKGLVAADKGLELLERGTDSLLKAANTFGLYVNDQYTRWFS